MNPLVLLMGVVFTALGAVSLGINLHWWDANVWDRIALFWPIILMILGLRLILRNSLLFILLALAIFVGVIVVAAKPSLYQRITPRDNSISLKIPHLTPSETVPFTTELETDASDTFSGELSGRFEIAINGTDTNKVLADLKGPKEIIEQLKLEKVGDEVSFTQTKSNDTKFLEGVFDKVTGTISLPRSMPLKLNLAGVDAVNITNYQGEPEINASGAAKVIFTDSTTTQTNVSLSGAGKVRLDTCSGDATFSISGAGEIGADRCTLQNLTIDSSGGGKVDIDSGTIVNLTLKTSGASHIQLPKPSGNVHQESSGSSNIQLQ